MMQLTLIAQCAGEDIPVRLIKRIKDILQKENYEIKTLNMEVFDDDQPAEESE